MAIASRRQESRSLVVLCPTTGASAETPPFVGMQNSRGGRPQPTSPSGARTSTSTPAHTSSAAPTGALSRRPRGWILLEANHRSEREHPGQIAEADGEQHQHQRPAAAEAEEPVVDSEPEGVPPPAASTPVPHHEAERRAALVQASVLERRELVEASEQEGSSPDHPGVVIDPADLVDGGVDAPVPPVDDEGEERPHGEIADYHESDEDAAVGAPPHERPKERDERQARRQHHRHRHEGPAADEDEKEDEVVLSETRLAPLSVAQEASPGRPTPDPEADPGKDD